VVFLIIVGSNRRERPEEDGEMIVEK